MAKFSLAALASTVAITIMTQAAGASTDIVEPIKPAKITNAAKVDLGAKLFFDPRLSKSGFISCNSCHNLSMGGSDNLKTSIGHNWQKGPINSPTVLNAVLGVAQFWDGRAKDLKEQAGGPIANPGEMASSHQLATDILNSIPGYVTEFKKVYGTDKITINEVTDAIAAFEETLVTPNSRFDKYLAGDKKALTPDEIAGWEIFNDSGCTACHNGAALGGATFQKMGLVEPYKTNNPAQGRVAVTKEEADRFNFKVPTLRNIELTYPYFHDGEAATMAEAVDIMGRIQLGKAFTPAENAKIVAFLKTLTGDQPNIKMPILPPSSDKTPRPEPFKD